MRRRSRIRARTANSMLRSLLPAGVITTGHPATASSRSRYRRRGLQPVAGGVGRFPAASRHAHITKENRTMKRLLLCMMGLVTMGWSQQTTTPPTGAAQLSGGGRGGAATGIERSNEVAGVDIDRFIGVAENSPVHLSHGTLLT